MTAPLRVSTLEVAHRQLNLAIRLLFAGADPVAVHTLVGAAATIFKNRSPTSDNKVAPPEYFRMTHKAQNLFKPGNMDPDALFELDPADTETLAYWAVINAGASGPLSFEEQLYQRWYLASHPATEDQHQALLSDAIQAFGDLRSKSRIERLQAGAQGLAESDASGPSDSTHWKMQGDYK